jgi:hypothetical protein
MAHILGPLGYETLIVLVSTLHQILDPVVLKAIAVGIKAIWIGDHFNFPIVVRGSSIGGYHSPLKVSMSEVCSIVIPQKSVVLLLLRLGDAVLHLSHTSLTQSSLSLTRCIKCTSLLLNSQMRIRSSIDCCHA